MSSGHIWKAPEMEKCKLCGDKDWMADKYCAGSPDVADKRKEWLEELAEQEQHNDELTGARSASERGTSDVE